MSMRYDAWLRPKPRQMLPKKLVLRQQFSLSPYKINATIWVPDVPYSKLKPKVCLTLSHGREQYIRFAFDSADDMVRFVESLLQWVKSNAEVADQALKLAVEEHETLWRKVREND